VPRPEDAMSALAQQVPIEAENIPQSNSLSIKDNITEIVVPADVVARSHPSGHSVPIIGKRRKLIRAHPYRNLVIISLVSLAALIGVCFIVYVAIEEHRAAGYHLACSTVGVGKGAHTVCNWEK
jgi:hypothetical protein